MPTKSVIIAGALSALPALFWLMIYHQKDVKDPEPKKVILLAFAAGVLLLLPFMALKKWLPIGAGGVLVFAALEEFAKLTVTIAITLRHKIHFNQLLDGAIYAITVALGFSFAENLLYFASIWDLLPANELLAVVTFRSFGTMLAHTLFSGLAGLLWAYAYFSKSITPFNQKGVLGFEWKDFFNPEILSLHIIRRNILLAHPSRRGGHEKKKLVLEGLVLATALHALFNWGTEAEFLGKNLSFLLIPAAMGGFFWASYWYTKKYHQEILKVV